MANDIASRANSQSQEFASQFSELLAKQIELYTLGDTSVISAETAFRLAASVLYACGVDIDAFDESEAKRLASIGLVRTHREGIARIERAFVEAKSLLANAALAAPAFGSASMKHGLREVEAFLNGYDARFFCADAFDVVSYPLNSSIDSSLRGADYAEAYLRGFLAECTLFEALGEKACSKALRHEGPNWKSTVVNMFEPIALQVILCALADGSIFNLTTSENAILELERELARMSKAEIIEKVSSGTRKAAEELQLPPEGRAELAHAARGSVPRIALAARGGNLGTLACR